MHIPTMDKWVLGAEKMVEELTDRNLEPEEKIECMSITDLVEHELREHWLELCGVGEGGKRGGRERGERNQEGRAKWSKGKGEQG